MILTGNTILITGGGSGIGRGLAEALHKLDNKIIIAGRRNSVLDEVVAANPGMASIELDMADADSIARVARLVLTNHPKLNVLINNAGIQRPDQADGVIDDAEMVAAITTNLMGPIRLTSALIEHLKKQDRATIAHVTSMLGILPMAPVAIYCATKAAMHSYAMTQRYKLRYTSVEVLEILPTYIATDLGRGKSDPRAMPLDAYIAETMAALATGAQQIMGEQAKARYTALRTDELAATEQFNNMMTATMPQ